MASNTWYPVVKIYIYIKTRVKNFLRIVWTVFEKTENSSKWLFLVFFWLISATFLRYQSYDFDAIAHAGAPLGVE